MRRGLVALLVLVAVISGCGDDGDGDGDEAEATGPPWWAAFSTFVDR